MTKEALKFSSKIIMQMTTPDEEPHKIRKEMISKIQRS